MEKEIIKKIIKYTLLLGLIVFLISFSVTFFKSKPPKESNENAEVNVKEVSLIEELKNQKDIKISNESIKDVGVEADFKLDFVYYLDKAEKADKPSTFNEIFKGKGKDIEFSTDFKYIVIKNKDKEEFFKLPSKYEENIKTLFDKEIYTAFDIIKQYDLWENVEVQYKDNVKKLNKEEIKELSDIAKKKRILSEYQASKTEEEDGFYLIINENELNIQIIGKNVIGIYNKEYKSYYEIGDELYNYLCDLFNISKENRIDSKQEDKNPYNWVENIEIKDVVNNIDEVAEKSSKDELIDALFSDNMEKVKFDTYEVKRYILKLNGKEKTEKITVYENHIEKDGLYYKVKGIDLIIDSFLNEF